METEKKILAILTGGKSRRMGSDKSSLPFGKESVLGYIIQKFRPCFDQIYISVSHPGLLDRLDIDDASGTIAEVEDLMPDMGPLGGIYSVLRACAGRDLFVTAVDMPFADPVALLSLAPKAARGCGGSTDSTFPSREHRRPAYRVVSDGRRAQPLFGWYGAVCAGIAGGMLSRGESQMSKFLERAGGEILAPADIFGDERAADRNFFNMNDRGSYYRALDMVRRDEHKIPLISVCAYSGLGKTTLIERLIPCLTERGLKVAVIKHDSHDFEIDVEGKDTYRFKKAGAVETVITSPARIAIVRDHTDDSLSAAAAEIETADIILVEGYKHGSQPKIVICPDENCTDFMKFTKNCVAIVGKAPLKSEIPSFLLNEVEKICEFILKLISEHKI